MDSDAHAKVTQILIYAGIVTHCMCYFNSAINPVIYYFMSAQFKVGCCSWLLIDLKLYFFHVKIRLKNDLLPSDIIKMIAITDNLCPYANDKFR